MILVDPPVSGPGRRKYPILLQWYFDGTRTARSTAMTLAGGATEPAAMAKDR